jgi:hypothetical protein
MFEVENSTLEEQENITNILEKTFHKLSEKI